MDLTWVLTLAGLQSQKKCSQSTTRNVRKK